MNIADRTTVPPPVQDDRSLRHTAYLSYCRVGLGFFLFSLIPGLLAFVISFLIHRFAPAILELPYFAWIMQVLLMYGIAFPVAYLVIGKPSLPTPHEPSKPSFLLFFTVFCLLSAVARIGSLVSEILMAAVERLLGTEQSNPVTEMLDGTPLLIVFLVVVVLGPLVEELLFRRAAMNKLLPFGEKSAILFSGVAFGVMHGNFYQLFYTVGMGLLIGYLYARTRAVIYPILLHMLYNFMGSIIPLSFMPYLEEMQTQGMDAAWLLQNAWPLLGMLGYSLLQIGLAVTGIVLLAVFSKRVRFEPTAYPLRAPEHARACFLNAGVILFLILACCELALSLIP